MPHALIIDDDLSNLKVLEQLLELAGFMYTTLEDPRQVKSLLNQKFDLVLLDLEMPDLNGYDVLALFQAQALWANVPIIACSVHTNEMLNAREQGFHSFLSKPLDADKFPQQLELILAGRAIWQR